MGKREFLELDARLGELKRRIQQQDLRALAVLQAELEVSWIYHDNALEGIVLSSQEITAALAGTPLPNDLGGALYGTVRAHKAAIDFINQLGPLQAKQVSKRGLITVSLLTQLHELLTPEVKQKGSSYRRRAPVHRVHHHRIAEPDKIPLRMRKLCESLDEISSSTHPLAQAAVAHFEFMAIYPLLQNNGKAARLLMNLLLLRAGYPPAIIPGGERQRYCKSLHAEDGHLADLITDALTNYSIAANQFFDRLTV